MQYCIIYTRFSPRKDAATSMSCELQRLNCEDYARKKGYEVMRVLNDPDVSGADEYRQTLWNAIDALKKGDILLVYKRDRLARNVYLSEVINRAVNKKGGVIEAVSGDVEGEGPEQALVRQIVAAMSEYERKIIGKRTSDAMVRRQSEGWRMSAEPRYGWKVDPTNPKRVVEAPGEQVVRNRIIELKKGGASTYAIANILNAEGVKTRCGGIWHRFQVSRVLLRVF